MKTLTLLYLAMGPGIALAVYLYYSDKWEPEPKALVLQSFLLGGLGVFPSAYIEGKIELLLDFDVDYSGFSWNTIVFAFAGVALVEEVCKVLVLKAFIYDRREFNEPFDGIVYGGMVGAGFATVENLMYVLPMGYSVGIMRMVTAVPGHVFSGMILGYFLGTAKFSRRPEKFFLKGILMVILLHGMYDVAAFSHARWSFYVLFATACLAIYFGLRAKRKLERHSKVMEFSPRKFWKIKEDKKTGPYTLKQIREQLSLGTLHREDLLLEVESGKRKTVRSVISGEIGLQRRALSRIPPEEKSLVWTGVFYVSTFGFYLYFWFYRVYREMRSFTGRNFHPERKALALFMLTIVPFYFYGQVMNEMEMSPIARNSTIWLYLLLAAIESYFVFDLLQKVHNMIADKKENIFNPALLTMAFFVLSSLRKSLPEGTPTFWLMGEFVLILQAFVLVRVQYDLNGFWNRERKK